KKIVVSSLLGNPMVVDAVKGMKIADLEKCSAYHMAFSKDDATVMGYDGNGAICTWEAASGKQTNAWAVGKRGLERGAFTPDGKIAAVAENDTGVVHLWDMTEGKEIGSVQNLKSINAVAITGEGKTVAVGSIEPKAKPEVKLWDVATQKELDGIKD